MPGAVHFGLSLLVGLTACQPSKEPPSPPKSAGGLRTQTVVLRCGDREISLQQLSDSRIRLSTGSEFFELDRVRSASGSKYQAADDSTTFFWSKGGGGLLQIRGEAFSECEPSASSGTRLRARGNEPGWLLEIETDRLTLEADYGESRMSIANITRVRTASGWRYLAGDSLTVTVLDELCVDDMTGMPHPKRVIVELRGRTLRGCGGDPSALLEGPEWIVEDVDGRGIIDMSHMSLKFEGNRLSGHGGCNSYTASYILDGEGLRLGRAIVTKKACAESLLRQEELFFSILEKVHRFSIDATGALVLHTLDGRTLLARR